MPKKVIQVPIDYELLSNLDRVSKIQQRARAELIREACLIYLWGVEEEGMDKIYRRGYEKVAEEEHVGRAQIELIGSILS